MRFRLLSCLALTLTAALALAAPPDPVPVEGQPLAANVTRVIQALDSLGAPLPADLARQLKEAGDARDARRLQELLDPQVLLVVTINPEGRVKMARGPGPAVLQQG